MDFSVKFGVHTSFPAPLKELPQLEIRRVVMSKERAVPVQRELDPSQLGCEEAEEAGMVPESDGLEEEREKKANTVKFGRGDVKYSPKQEIWKRNQIHMKIRRYVGEEVNLKSGGLGR